MQSLACTITTDHMRFHYIATNPGDVLFVTCLHMCILQSAARFYCRHVTWGLPEQIERTQPSTWQRLLPLTRSRVHILWFWACMLTGAPGVVYSTVKAGSQTEALQHIKASARATMNVGIAIGLWVREPPRKLGLLEQAVPGVLKVSGFWQWAVNNIVVIVSAAATSFGLDFIAVKLSGPEVDSGWLRLLGLLQAVIVFPGLARNNRAELCALIVMA
eukprot:5179585-Amphidinium_carterae.2